MTTCWQHPIVYQPIQFSDAGAAEKFERVGYKGECSPSSSRLSPVPLSVNSLSPVLPSLDVTDRRGTARSLVLDRTWLSQCVVLEFLAAFSKVFRKASLSLMREQFSRLAKSAASSIFSYFVSVRATRVKDWSRAWDRKIGYCELCCWQ